jgi:hypothetical protein
MQKFYKTYFGVLEVEIFEEIVYTVYRIIETYYLERVLLGAGLVVSLGIGHMVSTFMLRTIVIPDR